MREEKRSGSERTAEREKRSRAEMTTNPPDEMTVMRYELVERFERLFRSLLLNESD